MKAINEMQKLWDKVLFEQSWKSFISNHEINKKILLAFQPGPCYFWILNVRDGCFEMVSPEIETILGYKPQNVDFPFLFEKTHPEDIPYLLNFETSITDFFGKLSSKRKLSYKIQYDFRIQKADESYLRILNQVIVIEHNSSKNLIRTFGVHTDISLLKTDKKPILSLISLDKTLPSFIDVKPQQVFKPIKSFLTNREKEVLELIVEGKISKEIADILCITKFTVDSHRKNMLEKTNSKSIPEMVKKSILNGWI